MSAAGDKAAALLSVEQLVEYREAGWSYQRIADEIGGVGRECVGRYARRVLPPELLGNRGQFILHMCQSLDDGTRSVREIAKASGQRPIRVKEKLENAKRAGRERCRRCDFLSEEVNPVGEDGLCLWCRVEGRGWNLLEWYESGEGAKSAELSAGDGGGQPIAPELGPGGMGGMAG